MSELINNREMRKETLKSIISQLHQGKSVDEVKAQFEKAFQGVSAAEISDAETALILEGVPVEEIQNLCDVHASVFKGSIEDIHKEKPAQKVLEAEHPLRVFEQENEWIQHIIDHYFKPNLGNLSNVDALKEVITGTKELQKINIHYNKKENLLFPYLEKYEVTGPPKVMWGVDDEIRDMLKAYFHILTNEALDSEKAKHMGFALIGKVEEMIFKEKNILFPMVAEKLTEDEWKTIEDGCEEFGYLVEHTGKWIPHEENAGTISSKEETLKEGVITLPSGKFDINQLVSMLNCLPFDITFVDKDDKVAYFSEGKERIFARTRTVIGRNVSNCHPPASVHIVEQIVADFKSGKKDHEDFWLHMKEQFVYIRYFAVHDEKGEYLGVLEVTQNIVPILQLKGEKRLV